MIVKAEQGRRKAEIGGTGNWQGKAGIFGRSFSTCRTAAKRLLFNVAPDATLPPTPTFLNGVFTVAEHSKYQQKIIRNYYENQDTILLQRLGEQVTEIYLAEGKARAKRWKDIAKLLEKMKIPQTRVDNIVKQDNPALLAKLLEELLAKAK
jgi:hypothetical protein